MYTSGLVCFTIISMKIEIEKIAFWGLNIFFSACGFVVFLIMKLSYLLSVHLHHADPFGEQDRWYVIWIFLLTLFYWLLKLFLFPVIYKFKIFFPYTHNILAGFLTERQCLISLIKKVVILDISILILTTGLFGIIGIIGIISFDELPFLIFGLYLVHGGGALTAYLIFFVCAKIYSLLLKMLCMFRRIVCKSR